MEETTSRPCLAAKIIPYGAAFYKGGLVFIHFAPVSQLLFRPCQKRPALVAAHIMRHRMAGRFDVAHDMRRYS